MNNNIFLSIITLTFNNPEDLISTYESILNLNFPKNKVQLIIFDSSNFKIFCTNKLFVENLKTKGFLINHIYEKAKGIYHAMNSSINYSSGKFIIFMNSGDKFNKQFNIKLVQDMIEDFEHKQEYKIPNLIYGRAKICSIKNENITWLSPPENINPSKRIFWNMITPPMHQACFFKRSWHIENPYATDIGYKSDQLIKKKALRSSVFINLVISDFYLSGISSLNNLRFNQIIKITTQTKSLRYLTTNLIKFFLIKIVGRNWEYLRKFKTFLLGKILP